MVLATSGLNFILTYKELLGALVEALGPGAVLFRKDTLPKARRS